MRSLTPAAPVPSLSGPFSPSCSPALSPLRSLARLLRSALSPLLSLSRRGMVARSVVTLVLALGGSAAVAGTADTAVVQEPGTGPAVAAARSLTGLGQGQDAGDAGTAGDAGDAAAASWIDALPASVRDGLGYTPVIVDGLPADPAGDCSSPVDLPDGFTPACLTHDLGYDLLRVAAADGEDIPDGVRSGLDRQLTDRMSASCTGDVLTAAGCRTTARVAGAAVAVNTWRQGGGAPVVEHWPWA